jgi:dTDP-4-dehydrorhamnose reductase
MMRALVVGGDGLIGAAVADVMRQRGFAVVATTRRGHVGGEWHWFDLMVPRFPLPAADVAVLCAGIAGFRECEGYSKSWRINVDGVLAAGRHLLDRGTFVVYVSSTAVEWSDCAYARQRATVEVGLQAVEDLAIVRAEKVTAGNVSTFARWVAELADRRLPGVHHWPGT